MYSTEKSVDTEEYVVLKEETLNEANLNEKKIYDESNMEEKDIIVTKIKYDVRGGKLKVTKTKLPHLTYLRRTHGFAGD